MAAPHQLNCVQPTKKRQREQGNAVSTVAPYLSVRKLTEIKISPTAKTKVRTTKTTALFCHHFGSLLEPECSALSAFSEDAATCCRLSTRADAKSLAWCWRSNSATSRLPAVSARSKGVWPFLLSLESTS